MLRVIAGRCKGLKLKLPHESITRPSSSRLREAVFSILVGIIDFFEDVVVCDAFAGSGAMGIEAYSRGAKNVTFFEISKNVQILLNENIKSAVKNSVCDVKIFKDFFNHPHKAYDLIFIDPPYNQLIYKKIIDYIAHNNIIKPGGVMVFEHSIAHKITHHNLKIFDNRKYGNCQVTFANISKTF